jgi:hypothetical protein
VAALALAFAGWGAWRAYRRWRRNAYRREVLRRLAAIRGALADPGQRGAAPAELAALLRRAALHVAPRERVAALSGDAWLAFLDAGMGGDAFRGDAGRLVVTAPFQPAAAVARIPDADLAALFRIAERWLETHRASRYPTVLEAGIPIEQPLQPSDRGKRPGEAAA